MKLIEFTRGDTVYKKFQRKTYKRNDETGEIIVDEKTGEPILTPVIGQPNKAVFSVKENIYSNRVVIEKSLEDGTINYDEKTNYHYFKFEPEDTQDLSPDKEYYYDIEIVDNGDIKTIAKGVLRIKLDITTPKNRRSKDE